MMGFRRRTSVLVGVLVAVAVVVAEAKAKKGGIGMVSECEMISEKDALFVVDTQNDFMEAFPIPPGHLPNYDISKHIQKDGKIVAGSLAVANTSEILPKINLWIDYFNQKKARIFASLDWHSQNHCSFCRNGSARSNPKWYRPHGALCGPLPQPNFNNTGRCVDRVAEKDFAKAKLMQWPDHCIMQNFGSRFQPFLRLPKNTTVVKKGWDLVLDTYSAFGGTKSVEEYPFDTKDTKPDLQHQARLNDLLVSQNIERFWVVGIALDFCVGSTVLDSLGKNNETQRPKPKSLEKSILILPCTRAVDPVLGGPKMVEAIRKAGGIIVNESDPELGIRQACAN
mmetsp:Transcript_21573/g.38271  ORF Transcript_21573/g.38271 Transcript_21573/m.38271 type:complete len:339 (+) Transcript_21573:83-1099(+)